MVTTFAAPDGNTAAAVTTRLRRAGAVLTTPAPGPLAGQVLRINHTGRNADVALVQAELASFAAILG